MNAPAHVYAPDDPETALKYAVQRIRGFDRVQVIEGLIEPLSPSWDHERTAAKLRQQLTPVLPALGCMAGSGDLDLTGSPNWFVPDLAVVPRELAKGGGALVPGQTLLIVEVTSDSNGDTDRIVKRRRYAEYGAPLFLLVDRQQRTCTLFSAPGDFGYTKVDGPHPFGTPLPLPEPFGLELDTSDF
ncbi:Uma2 family endonuclease [Streptomyces sp. S465]|uniref:Uma2 family endonuclease n=1 Tax=Streptomyces sp. S465 TaxID=2979468 RepID=UPI0022A863F1|nr:Uma2 family endonuclease [Streptomyces sp. S465]WAP58817.1 Uma2 family endonuclease [Streptomyces sp. S465]